MRNEWSPHEDGQRGSSRLHTEWTPDDQFVWQFEVRAYHEAGSYRIGEVRLRGSWDGALRMSIVPIAAEGEIE